jgi:hypothetical protein
MARYIIKRKTKQFGVISQTGASLVNGVGSGVEAIGDAAKSGVGKTAAGIGSALTFGGTLAATLGGGPLGAIGGYLGSYLAGKAAANAAGSGLQSLGQSMQYVQG